MTAESPQRDTAETALLRGARWLEIRRLEYGHERLTAQDPNTVAARRRLAALYEGARPADWALEQAADTKPMPSF